MSGFKRVNEGGHDGSSKKAHSAADDTKCVNTVRLLSADAVEKAKSGTQAHRWAARLWLMCCLEK